MQPQRIWQNGIAQIWNARSASPGSAGRCRHRFSRARPRVYVASSLAISATPQTGGAFYISSMFG
jgi:hypothetical protein